MNVPVGLTPEQTRQYLQRQANMGRYMILGTVIITAVNLVFLLLNSEFYITYSAATGFYAVWLGKLMDNQYLSVLGPNGVYTCTGLVLAALVLGVLLLLWWLAKKDSKWMKAAMGLLIADTAVLLLFCLGVLQGGIVDVLWDLVIHIAVIVELGKGISARQQLRQLPKEEPRQPEESLYGC